MLAVAVIVLSQRQASCESGGYRIANPAGCGLNLVPK
jgi:hypothetical protein